VLLGGDIWASLQTLPWKVSLFYNKERMLSAENRERKDQLRIAFSWLILIVLLLCTDCRQAGKSPPKNGKLQGNISISTSFALYPLILKWTDEFHRLHPEVEFDVAAVGADKSVSDNLAGLVDLGGISREVSRREEEAGLRGFAVARDAVVAIVSEDNPHLRELLSRGCTRQDFAQIWLSRKIKTWGELVADDPTSSPIRSYTRADMCGAGEIWGLFLGGLQEDLRGIGVHGESWMVRAVKEDPLGVGYTNLNFAYDALSLEPIRGIRVVPIDLDENGRVDAGEDFYANRGRILEAIASRKYPSPPSRDLYLISRGIPKKRSVREFVTWSLTGGQVHVSATGYIPLLDSELEKGRRSLAAR
jgi:phosphate transport system substrate-binding protein